MRWTVLAVLGGGMLIGDGAGAADVATAKMIAADHKGLGEVTLTDTPNGVLMRGRLEGLEPGPHAIHLHAAGRCEPPFDSAGAHFNPADAVHGYLSEGGPHAGDLPNLHVPEGGSIDFELLAPGVTLRSGEPNGLMDDDGAAIVIHAGADDYKTDPAGASGSRLACGIVKR